jgi:type I restriction enzyme S subunit
MYRSVGSEQSVTNAATKRWGFKTLGELCDIKGGGTPSTHVQSYWQGNIPWVSPKDMKSETIIDSIDHISSEAIGHSAANLISKDSILMVVRSGILARIVPIALAGRDLAINQDVKAFMPKPCIHSRFLYLFLESQMERLLALVSKGATVHRLNIDQIKMLSVPVPALKEQERIVAILDEAFQGISAAKENAKVNQQHASTLLSQELSTLILKGERRWKLSTLGSAAKFIDYRGRTPEKTSSGLPLITAKNVRMGYIKDEPREFVAPESYEGWMTRGIPKIGDVLFTTEAPLANVAQLGTSERVVFAQRIIIMQPDPKTLDSTFLKFLLLSPPLQKGIHEKGTGATATGIKASLLKAIKISFPPSVEEQVALSERLSELSRDADRLAAIYVQKLEVLEALKRSLLYQAFSGNL